MNEWKPDICIYHGNCNDGFGAAWAVWNRWGNAVQYVPAHYGKPLDVNVTGKHVLFVDFSLKIEEMIAMSADSIVVLDHHKTAKSNLMPFAVIGANKNPVTPDVRNIPETLRECKADDELPIVAYFDMEKSGARLAWEFCFPGVALPNLLAHVEDRDLWRFALSGTKEIHAGLSSYAYDFDKWDELAGGTLAALFAEGYSILRMQDKRVAELCDMASIQDIASHNVPCVNAPFFLASDVAHELLRRHPDAQFAATYQTVNGTRVYSLRSEDSRADVSEVAKRLGGGGHRNAAGLSVPDVPVFF